MVHSERAELLPPQDISAERSVLGAMLLSKDAIADVVEAIRPEHFYRPAHQSIYLAVLELYGRGEPADFITVADELQKSGDLERIGGAAYVTELTRDLPSAVNASYHAEIVRERYVLRRLVEAGTRITQYGYAGEGHADDIVNRAQAEIYEITTGRKNEDYAPLADILEGSLAEIEAIANHDGDMIGVPTGLRDLDALTQGLHPGQLLIFAARPAIGKALALDTPIATPQGWTTMGELRVGDEVFAPDGTLTPVVAATEVMVDRPCFRVRFSDGTTILADAEHLWFTETRAQRRERREAVQRVPVMAGAAEGIAVGPDPVPWGGTGSIHTTRDLATSLFAGSRYNHSVPGLSPLQVPAPAEVVAEWRQDERRITSVTPVPSVPVRCIQVGRADGMFLAGRTLVPTHNSTLGLDVARSASIHNGLASVIFSLEMSRTEIMMRLLSAEGQIQLNNIRSGRMSSQDWQKIARRQDAMRDAPLFIDDSPNMTMTEIRAKCRRLKQQHDLRLVIVDYMQLMTSGKKVESRQQEVSEFSRALKLLAKELEVPVIAISQLNRGPEQRTDKKPMLADLRESGCLTADTKVVRADTGAEITMGELYESGARDIPVWSLDESLRYRARTMTHVFPTGHREVFEVRLRSGRVVKATDNHPLLTYRGFRAVGDLAAGSRVAVPRHVPPPMDITPMDEDEIVLLAHLLGDGSFVKRQPIRYASVSEENLVAVAQAAQRRFGIQPVRDDYPEARVTTLRLPAPYRLARGRRNPIAQWLDQWGLFGLRSHEKFIPAPVFSAPKEQVATFIRHLWATDGCIRRTTQGGGHIYYATTSRRLADDLARLLLRFGLIARIAEARKPGYRPSYHVLISGSADQKVFLRRIGGFGPKAAAAAEVLACLQDVPANTNVDTVPREVWDDVRELIAASGMTHRQFQQELGSQYCGSSLFRYAPSRGRLSAVAAVLDSAELELMATNDVFWDEIVSIRSLGHQDVFDATVLGTHNFIADGVVVHNSLEQDADMVVLIHREDFYDKENRPGEADLIVAKHRNGPTDTIAVSFQGHYSRFVDLAG